MSLFVIDDMDAAGYHDDRDDVLNPELFVKEERCEDDAQHRDQRIVDCDLADRMIGQQGVVDGKADSGDGSFDLRGGVGFDPGVSGL